MRKVIAALQTSVDGFIEGPNRELDWAMADDEETWREMDETLSTVDTFILGRGMYPEYEQYWLTLLANPKGGMKSPMHDGPIRYPTSSFPRPWIKWHGRRHGLFGT